MMMQLLALLLCVCGPTLATPDGKVFKPVDYEGSLEERAQEALLIFHKGTEKESAVEEMILKIRVEGEVDDFAWVVPLPNPPETFREDPKLFEELHRYVNERQAALSKRRRGDLKALGYEAEAAAVDVISREVVGSYDVTVVRENEADALNGWLEENGYQALGAEAEDVLAFYRRKGYVYACIKVTGTALSEDEQVDLHPLRFRFETGGRDGIYFPMKLTGLQEATFDVNLHVFYEKWINDRRSPYGFVHRGFDLIWRDYDSRDCEPNAGKAWSAPKNDPYLRSMAHLIPAVTSLFQKLHPGDRFYLTNIQARRLDPKQVRDWASDLWLFPHYTDPDFVPYDARPGGVAAAAYERLR